MRCTLFATLVLYSQAILQAATVMVPNLNSFCDARRDTILLVDPERDIDVYYRCVRRSDNYGSFGFWQRNSCPIGSYFDYVNQRCRPAQHGSSLKGAIYGASCANGEVCVGEAVCDPRILKCLCPIGTEVQAGALSCIKFDTKSPYGQDIIKLPKHAEVVMTSAFTREQSPFIDERLPKLFNLNLPNVEKLLGIGSKCKRSSECDSMAMCLGGICACSEILQEYEGRCVMKINTEITSKADEMLISSQTKRKRYPTSKVNMFCSTNMECVPGAYCNGGNSPPTCQCLSTHVDINSTCQKIYFPGQTGCQEDLQCSSTHSDATCNRNQCVCPTGFQAIEQTCKIGITLPGTACNSSLSTDTCSANSICIDSICQCPFPLIKFQHQCINKHRFQVSSLTLIRCKNSENCPPDLKCFDGKCECPSGSKRINTTCVLRYRNLPSLNMAKLSESEYVKSQLFPKQKCNSNEDGKFSRNKCLCINGHGICTDGYCICKEDDRARSDKYMERRAIRDCAGSVDEDEGQPCQIYGAFRPIKTRCEPNDRCIGGAVCLNANCQCTSGSVETGGLCRQAPGGRCVDGQICSGRASCTLTICRCSNGHHIRNRKCVQDASYPGQSCQQGQRCANGSICTFGLCMCTSNYHRVGETCEKLANSSMKVNMHTLVVKNEPKADIFDRQKVVTFGNACESNQVCQNDSKCIDGRCTCDEREILIGGRCAAKSGIQIGLPEQKAAPGQYCEDHIICAGGSVCSMKICTCPPETRMSFGECVIKASASLEKEQSSDMLISPGSICSGTSKCLPPSKCVRNVCRCKTGETIIDGNCRKAVYKISPGGVCKESAGLDCVGESLCIEGICECKKGLAYSNFECAHISDPGKKLPILLHSNNTDQSQFTIQKQHEVSDSLWHSGMPYQGCTREGYCWNGGQCIGNICACSRGYAPINNVCQLKRMKLHGMCDIDKECPMHAKCDGGTCMCKSPFAENSGNCIGNDIARPGNQCSSGQICGFHSRCDVNVGICVCPHGLEETAGECKLANKDNICITNADCILFAFCFYGYCICDESWDENSHCIPYFLMSFVEKSWIQSYTQNSNDGAKPIMSNTPHAGPFHASFNHETSSEKRTLLDDGNSMASTAEFPSSHEIFNNLLPLPNIYSSQPYYFHQNYPTTFPSKTSKRWKPTIYVMPGGLCNRSKTCAYNSFCVNNRCRCKSGTVGFGRSCVDFEEFYGYQVLVHQCSPLQPCQLGFNCINLGNLGQYCLCPIGMQLVDTMCQKSLDGFALPNDYCDSETICANNAICNANKCECAMNDILVLSTCLKLKSLHDVNFFTLPGHSCNFTHDTCIDNSFCSQTYLCECKNGYKLLKNHCVPHAIEQCEKDNQCERMSKCIRGMCKAMAKRPVQSFKIGDVKNGSQIKKKRCVNDNPQASTVRTRRMTDGAELGCQGEEICRHNYSCNTNNPNSNAFEKSKAYEERLTHHAKLTNSNTYLSQHFKRVSNRIYTNNATELNSRDDIVASKPSSIQELKTAKLKSIPGGSCMPGYQCSGGSVCKEGWCICPISDMIVVKGICVISTEKVLLDEH